MNRRLSKEIESSQDRRSLVDDQGFVKSAFEIQGPVAQILIQKILLANHPGDFVYGSPAHQELCMMAFAELEKSRVLGVVEVNPQNVGPRRHDCPHRPIG